MKQKPRPIHRPKVGVLSMCRVPTPGFLLDRLNAEPPELVVLSSAIGSEDPREPDLEDWHGPIVRKIGFY